MTNRVFLLEITRNQWLAQCSLMLVSNCSAFLSFSHFASLIWLVLHTTRSPRRTQITNNVTMDQPASPQISWCSKRLELKLIGNKRGISFLCQLPCPAVPICLPLRGAGSRQPLHSPRQAFIRERERLMWVDVVYRWRLSHTFYTELSASLFLFIELFLVHMSSTTYLNQIS